MKKANKGIACGTISSHHLGGEGGNRQGTWKLNPTSDRGKYSGKRDRVCYWDYFGQAHTEPGEEFPRQRKDKCEGPEAEICSVLEEQKEGWPG